jgi:hypothetical protein
MAKLKRVFCANCKKPIFRSTGRFNEGIKFGWKTYCSRKCEYQYKTRKRKLECENCGKNFERTPHAISPHNYCSQACAAIVNNGKNPKRKPQFKTCLSCGKQFRKSLGNLKYCSMECRGGRKPNYTSQELINIIKQEVQELHRIPSRREIRKVADSCKKAFGSWNNAIIAAGFQPNRSHSQRMYKRVFTKALDGHPCDSVSELLVDNWLAKNNIPHKRDTSYPNTHHKADWEIPKADWKIPIENQKIFVEYFGLANDSPRYDRAIKEKRGLCRKNKISLIAIYPQDLYPKEFLEENLKEKFKNFLNA